MKNPVHPGRIIRHEYLDELGISVAEAARRIQVSRPALAALLNGRGHLTADLAFRLEKAFGLDKPTFLRIQNSYDLAAVKRMERFPAAPPALSEIE